MAATLAGSSIVSVWPSRDLTIRFWPLSLSTVPRMRVGVRPGGVWARAGPTDRAMGAAIAILSVLPFYSRRQQRLTRRWREMDSNHRSLARKSRFLLRKRITGTNGAAKKGCFLRGTDGSNPSPSSGESAANPARRVTSQTSSATASGFARNGGCVSKLGMQRFTAPEHGRLVAPDRVDLVHLASSSPWPKMLCFSRGRL